MSVDSMSGNSYFHGGQYTDPELNQISNTISQTDADAEAAQKEANDAINQDSAL